MPWLRIIYRSPLQISGFSLHLRPRTRATSACSASTPPPGGRVKVCSGGFVGVAETLLVPSAHLLGAAVSQLRASGMADTLFRSVARCALW